MQYRSRLSSDSDMATDLGQPARKWHFAMAIVALLIVIGSAVYYEYAGRQRLAEADCVRRGVISFRQAGSYPTIRMQPDKGRNTVDVARERCSDNSQVF